MGTVGNTQKLTRGNIWFLIFSALLIFPMFGPPVWAESSSPIALEELLGRPVRLETSGGGNFQGTLLSVTEDRVELIESDGQIIQISREAIEKYQELETSKRNKAFFQDSASNRLIFMPTAFAMEQGEFHVCDQEGLVITSSYGLSKNISLWGGISPLGAVLSGRFILSITESFAVTSGSFAGIEWVGVTGAPVSGMLMPYLISSWGEPNSNFTAGAAVAFSFSTASGFDTLGFLTALAGKIVLTATTALVTENWIIWAERDNQWDPIPGYAFFGLVFRIAGSRFSWDIGAILPMEISREEISGLGGGGEPFIPLPWISVTYRIR